MLRTVFERILPGLALLLVGVAIGLAVQRGALPSSDASRSAGSAPDASREAERAATWLFQERDDALASRLAALGYLQGYEQAMGASGVVVHEPARAQPGLNFYTSGHAPEAILMSMEGEILHTWRRAFSEVCPGEEPASVASLYWRRARLLPDGGVVAIFDYHALFRLDREGTIVWRRCEPYHHDLVVDSRGYTTVLRRRPKTLSRGEALESLYDDEIEVLDPRGQTVSSVSILDAFANSDRAPLLDRIDVEAHEGDVLHTNTVEVLDGSHTSRARAFAAGNYLISIRNLDTLAIIDGQSRSVVWALTGMFRQQHDPVLLPSGNLLVFDNLGDRGKSRVVELDPLGQEVVWTYRGEPGVGFVSPCCGASQRLANGNTLITDTYGGRAVEVTESGRTVWEWRSPHRAGEDDELVAVLMDLVRLEDPADTAWLHTARAAAPRPARR